MVRWRMVSGSAAVASISQANGICGASSQGFRFGRVRQEVRAAGGENLRVAPQFRLSRLSCIFASVSCTAR